ncbi:MAG: glycosyltransferase family 4 protein [Lachnospiraceae bacterium]|nr:glycosyltransferase family 4 protein [Lachnospiraceae bacterium]
MYIWLINHYAVPPRYYPLARQTYFAKYLMEKGHKVTVISASTVHNSDKNLIEDGAPWKREEDDGVDHLYVNCRRYEGNGFKRVLNMYEFARKLPKMVRMLERPDAVVSTSMPPMSCAKGIAIARKLGVPAIAEIADLWPESLIAYDVAGPRHPFVLYLRRLEKWIYTKSDAVIFTMGGGYDYIRDQGWEKEIPAEKVFQIQNGVDLRTFDENREKYRFDDPDLDDPGTYKIVYAGSLRKGNEQILRLLDAVKLMQGEEYRDYRFLIYGKGPLLRELEEKVVQNGYGNVRLKGFVDKKYIPYILSKCDLNILDCVSSDVLRYGGSQNKLFDYLASGKPVISGEGDPYSVVSLYGCGISRPFGSAEDLVEAINEMKAHPVSYEHIRSVAEKYDFKVLTDQLLEVIRKCEAER